MKLAWNPGGKTKGTIHHRHPRRLGGKDTPTNLVVLCHSCHRAVHRDEPAAALEGWLCWVPSDVTPLLLPSGWALLVPDGSTEPLDQEEAELLLAYLHGSYRKVLDKTAC